MPKLLHESTGLKIVKNENNSFVVCTLHYTADPNKRSLEWRREAGAGMDTAKAARELEIDYTAILGARVFPEITEKRSIIVTPTADLGPDLRYWGGFDYGIRNPTSFHVYTIVDGVVYSVWELFKPCTNIPDFVEEMKSFKYWNHIRYIAADPSCWSPHPGLTGVVSVQDLFWKNGVRNFIKGINNQEDTWITMMREHWTGNDPTFRIMESCPNQIREFETAIFVNQSQQQLMSSSFRETINDKDNHSLDDCKYFMLSMPKAKQQQDLSKSGIVGVERWTVPNHKAPPTVYRSDGKGYYLP